MEIHGDPPRSVDVHGDAWSSMEAHRNLWRYMGMCGRPGRSYEVFIYASVESSWSLHGDLVYVLRHTQAIIQVLGDTWTSTKVNEDEDQ